jgi:hypothetical protein
VSNEAAARVEARDSGLRLIRSWTMAAAVAGAGLTALLAYTAAASFPGHQVGNSSSSGSSGSGLSGGTDQSQSQSQDQFQNPVDGGFGSTNQSPYVTSGGS